MESKLFQPLKVGTMPLAHRIIMAPLTRFRSDELHIVQPIVKEYYAQRASVPGSFIVSEATFISPQGSGYPAAPGIWTPEQISAWQEVTDAVHAKGSFIYCQLWCLGRAAKKDVLSKYGLDVVSSSGKSIGEQNDVPRPLREEEIWKLVGEYATAAKNAIKAGFDGVEIHGANGYMIDQFTQSVCNDRTDSWGGSVEKRARFALEVTKAVVKAVGKEHVGIRLSPHSTFQGMRMPDGELEEQFTYLISQLRLLDLAYLHMTTPRVHGTKDITDAAEKIDWAVETWGKDKPVILAGGVTAKIAKEDVDVKFPEYEVLIAFGRYYISTPDLPFRLKHGIEFNQYIRPKFYSSGPEGYLDYPFSKEWIEAEKEKKAGRL